MEQNTVRFGRRLRQRLRFVRRDIQDLHPPGRDFLLMIMEVLVPLFQRHVGARELLVNEVFDLHQLGVGGRAAINGAAEDDLVVDQSGWRVFVDPFSAQYLNGVTIDYVTSMMGSGFTFKNPNATGGCGCGSSFSA